MKTIEIENFITIKILDLSLQICVYFVDSYNEKYFYINNNELCTYQKNHTVDIYTLYFQKARIIHRDNLDKLKKDVYDLHRQLTFKTDRAEVGREYYIISRNFNVVSATEFNDIKDDNQYRAYNYFLSKVEAEKYAKKLQQFLIDSRKEEYLKGE